MLEPATLRKFLKGEKQLTEVKPGLTAKQHILHWVLETYVENSHKFNLWQVLEKEFSDAFTLEDFLVSPNRGTHATISGIYWALLGVAYEHPLAWEFIVKHYGKKLTLEHILAAPKEGRDVGVSGLWWALFASCCNSQAWEFIATHFGKQLKLAHFLTAPKEGRYAGWTGVMQALYVVGHDYNTQAWEFIAENFSDQLTLDHFLTVPKGERYGESGLLLAFEAKLTNQKSPLALLCKQRLFNQLKVQHIEQTFTRHAVTYSVLHSLCRATAKKIDLIEHLAQILINNADAVLKIDFIILDNTVPPGVRLLLKMHQKIAKLKADIGSAKKADGITTQRNALVKDAQLLQAKHMQSVGYFLLAQCLFTSETDVIERLSCLRQIDEKSLFAEEADFEQANLLFLIDCDKDGNDISSGSALNQHARKTALEIALKLVTRCAIEAHLEKSYTHLKRRIVEKLLDEDSVDNSDAFSWADKITDFAILLQRIADEKIEMLKQKIHQQQAQIGSLSSELNEVKDILATYRASPPILMKQQCEKGQRKITDMFAALSIRQKPKM